MDFKDLQPGPAPQLPVESFAVRRARAAAALEPDEVLVVATHAPQLYSNDVDPRFRPHSDFWYLTGFEEPHAVLVLDASGTSTLFLQDSKPDAEIWHGRRLGVARACDVLGMDQAFAASDLPGRIEAVVAGRNVRAIVDHDPRVRARLRRKVGTMEDGSSVTAELRVRKDKEELRMLQKAADVGVEAMVAAAPMASPGRHEYELEAELLRSYRTAGSTGPGYPPIVGTGANGAILHYISNRSRIRKGDLVLVDAGCEWGYYNSDITRTFPAGEATGKQRDLYQVVLQAHAAALKLARPGKRLREVHDAAATALAQGLIDLGHLDGSLESVLEKQHHRRHFMHGTSHFLGLDVHDVGSYKGKDGKSRLLEPGMVITIEPGLYFNPDFAPCPPGTAGIGIRVEDDVVITEGAPKVLTRKLPLELDEVAALMRP